MTGSTPVTSTPATGRVIMIAAAAALGGFLFGFDTAVINGAVGAVRDWSGAGNLLLGFSVSGALLGCAIGAWFAGPIANRFGRIRVMQVAAFVFFSSSVGCAFAWDIWSLTGFRLYGGLAVGAASVIAPAYIAEVSPARIRGRLGSLQQLAIVTGIFVALLVAYALAETAGSAANELWFGMEAWRWMFLSEIVPAAVYGVLASGIPESPRYLVGVGRLKEAAAVLSKYVGGDVEAKIVEIKATLHTENKQSVGDLKGPRFGLLPIVWVGILLCVFQQFVGINVIFYYSSVLWQAVGFGESAALGITVFTSVTNIATTLLAIAVIDRIGRKPLLLIGCVGMAATLGTMAFVFGTAPLVEHCSPDEITAELVCEMVPQLGDTAGVVAIVAANLYVIFFGMSWGPVVWVLLGEMFNNRIRVYAIAVAAAAQWIANFVVSTTFPTLSSLGLGLAYGIYTSMAVLSLFFVIKFVRETKGKELEEMV